MTYYLHLLPVPTVAYTTPFGDAFSPGDLIMLRWTSAWSTTARGAYRHTLLPMGSSRRGADEGFVPSAAGVVVGEEVEGEEEVVEAVHSV